MNDAALFVARFLRDVVLSKTVERLEAGDATAAPRVWRMLRGALAAKGDLDVKQHLIAKVLLVVRDVMKATNWKARDMISPAREYAAGALDDWDDDTIVSVLRARNFAVRLTAAFNDNGYEIQQRRVEQLIKRPTAR